MSLKPDQVDAIGYSLVVLYSTLYKTSRLLLVIALWKLPTIMLPLLLKKKADPFKKK